MSSNRLLHVWHPRFWKVRSWKSSGREYCSRQSLNWTTTVGVLLLVVPPLEVLRLGVLQLLEVRLMKVHLLHFRHDINHIDGEDMADCSNAPSPKTPTSQELRQMSVACCSQMPTRPDLTSKPARRDAKYIGARMRAGAEPSRKRVGDSDAWCMPRGPRCGALGPDWLCVQRSAAVVPRQIRARAGEM